MDESTIQSENEENRDLVTSESISLPEWTTENIISINDYTDDEPLLSVPPISNRRNNSSSFCLRTLICLVIFGLVMIGIINAIIILKRSSTTPRVLAKGCNRKSQMGKSCSINNLESVVLLKSSYNSLEKTATYSFIYTAISNTTIVTFSFGKENSEWNLDDVSIRDMTNNIELIEDGGFESGTFYAFCVCDSSIKQVKLSNNRNSKVCEIKTLFSAVQLAQSVRTIPQRIYNISFWLQNQRGFDQQVTVYISTV